MATIGNIGNVPRTVGEFFTKGVKELGKLFDKAFPQESPLKGTRQVGSSGSITRGSGLDEGVKRPRQGFFEKLKQWMSPPAPHYESREMPTGKQDLQRIREDAKLSNFPYTRDLEQLPPPWVPSNRLTEGLVEKLGLSKQGVEFRDGTLVDPKSGLTATVLVNPKTKEVVVAFGGTTSGKKVGGDLMERSQPGRNFMTSLSQWGTNFKAGLGGVPKSYQQAATLVQEIVQRVKESKEYEGYTVRTVGHSKGGGEAMYAALKQDEPLRCTAFCPSHLGRGLVKDLPPENLERAKELVQSYSPYGDPVSALRGKVPDLLGVGVGSHFPGIEGSNPIHLHDQFLQHVEHHCKDG